MVPTSKCCFLKRAELLIHTDLGTSLIARAFLKREGVSLCNRRKYELCYTMHNFSIYTYYQSYILHYIYINHIQMHI